MIPFVRLLAALVIIIQGGPKPQAANQEHTRAALVTLVQKQQTAMLTHNLTALRRLYTANGTAQEGLSNAILRSGYLSAWARLHRLQWTSIAVTVRTPLTRMNGPDSADFYAIEQKRYQFHYQDHPHTTVWFGMTSRHYLSIGERKGIWKITGDDFPNQVNGGNVAGASVPDQARGGHPPAGPWGPGRMAAVGYANQYCGDAPGCGNARRYNPAYRNYNPVGGDCTNFISQVLFAGGLPMTHYWQYDQTKKRGSGAWVTAPGLAGFLRRTGRAHLVAAGSYAFVTRHTTQYPEGAVETLRPGDLVSYQTADAPTHSAVVVGYDVQGVPLVDTHTADRFRVPWDFGWPTHTVFYVWHVRYPDDVATRPNEMPPTKAALPAVAAIAGTSTA